MSIQIDYNDPRYAQAAAEILRRHDSGEPEANITSAVRDFLILTGLVRADEIVEENPPAQGSRRAVDLAALDTFMEFKRRIGTAGGFNPNPEYVGQLDDYLEQSQAQGRIRMGILTDGRRWLLRWPNAGPVRTALPYAFTLEDADRWIALYGWLRDSALVSLEGISPDREGIAGHFGPGSPSYQRDIAALKALYQENADLETIRVKRQLWYDLLRTALGEIAYSPEGMSDESRAALEKVGVGPEEMDDLFVRHTYLGAVIGMVVQASFGIDIRRLAATDPADLLQGRELYRATGLQGVLESDFFTWPNEIGGNPLLQTLARRVARFDWADAPPDTAATLYETIIPPEERRQLGEYYTPTWLARAMIRELVDAPLNQRVLDPACGSGTFVAEAVAHFIAAAGAANCEPKEVLNRLREAVTGIDVHPVAVHLARAAWTLAARPAINAASAAGYDASLSIPVYLGDALQLRFRTGDMFAENQITIQTMDEENTELVFPISLVQRAENFDALMGDISTSIERGDDPALALDDNAVNDPAERQIIGNTIAAMQRLHDRGRNHIWAYYTRNMVRPVALSRSKGDVVIGNPPWINYNQTADILRTGLQSLSRNLYGIWAGGHYATQQDVAGLFFARSVDLYLKDGGVIGFVLPHSALQGGQYAKWRGGRWRAGKSGPSVQVDFTFKPAWDLERLEPNTFFPVPASVVFARKLTQEASGKPLAGSVERWLGEAGASDVRREFAGITDTGAAGESPYAALSRNGATIFPRVLFFVSETANTAIVQAAPTITVIPRRGNQDKAPWKDLDLTAITGQTVENRHLFDVHLGETIAPYVTLEPLKALLPLKQGDVAIPTDGNGPGGIRLGGLEQQTDAGALADESAGLWEDNKALANRLNLSGATGLYGKIVCLSRPQLEWQSRAKRPTMSRTGAGRCRLVCGRRIPRHECRTRYQVGGQPTAALLVMTTAGHWLTILLFWIPLARIPSTKPTTCWPSSTAEPCKMRSLDR